MKVLNNRGSILQIVLILFMILVSTLTIAVHIFSLQISSTHSIQIIMKQKNLEVLLVRYFLEELEGGFLMSDSIEENDYYVDYTVDDMGNYSYINTEISFDDVAYAFSLEIDHTTFEIKNFEYKEGGWI